MKNKRFIICVIVLAAITLFIFANSMTKAEVSYLASDEIKDMIGLESENGKIDYNHVVRKIAHVLEFMALGIATAFVTIYLNKNYLGYALFYMLGIGVADEFIQSFSGRSSLISDVLLDFFGALLGFVIVMLIFYKKEKPYGKEKK